MEDALYEIASMRLFAGLSLDKAIPEHTTIMNFSHLLERKGLARKLFNEVRLTEAGFNSFPRSCVGMHTLLETKEL